MNRKEELARFRQIVENAKELISETDENGVFTYVSPQHEAGLGYRPEELLGTSAAALLHPEDLQRALDKHDTIRKASAYSADVWRFLHKDGSYRSFECRGSVYTTSDGKKHTIVISHDITEQEKIRKQFESFMEHLPGAAFIKDGQNRLLFCNRTYASLIGSTPEELRNHTIEDRIPEELQEKFREENRKVIEEHEVLSEESVFPSPEGETCWLTHKFPIRLGEETLLGAVSFDITPLKKTERQLQHALEDRDLLMEEVHHRVKNNFVMINSLLSIKEYSEGFDFSDLKSRIDTIRFVHEKLYSENIIKGLDFHDYSEDLLSHIFSTSRIRPVHTEVRAPHIFISSAKIITLGLIINEIAVNAMKYGFNEKVAARFVLDLSESGGHFVLSLSNSGNPFPEEMDTQSTETIGMSLIDSLVKKLRGSCELIRSPETCYTIRFPRDEVA